MSLHRFNPEIAKIVGINAAVLFENILFWVEKNEANSKHKHDDKYWTYNSHDAFTKLFPYLSTDQIRGALNKLIKAELIEVGEYNKIGYDRTKWYALGNWYKSQMQLVKIPNGYGENPRPIPDNKPDNKPYVKDTVKSTDLPKRIFTAWNDMASKNGLAKVNMSVLNPNRAREVIKRLNDCQGDEKLLFNAIQNVPNNPHWIALNDGTWKANFDFVFRASQFQTVLEYDTYTPPNGDGNGKRTNQNNGKPQTMLGAALDNYKRSSNTDGNAGDMERSVGGLQIEHDTTTPPSNRRLTN